MSCLGWHSRVRKSMARLTGLRHCVLATCVLIPVTQAFQAPMPSVRRTCSGVTPMQSTNSAQPSQPPANPFANFLGGLFPNAKAPAQARGVAAAKKEYVVAVTGATGLIGTALTKALSESTIGGAPVRVVKLVRRSGKGEGEVTWDPYAGELDVSVIEGADAVVHLAGENVGSGSEDSITGRLGAWSDKKKEKILESRSKTTSLLASSIARAKNPPQVFVTASAVGYYGYNQGNKEFTESSAKGEGFLAEVVEVWEKEAKAAAKKGVRVVNARFGVVLDQNGGILGKLGPLFNFGLGGVIGDGKQYFSWVSLRDAVSALKFIIENPSVSGPVNVVSPNPVTNAQFTTALGSTVSRPTLFPLPQIAASAVFGQMGDEMLLGGQRAVPSKLQAAGFKFQDADIKDALAVALGKKDATA